MAKAPLQENATRDLAQFAATLQFEAIPCEVIEKLKLLALDGIGCCIFGATLPWTRKGPGGPLTPLLSFLAAQQPINDIDIRFWAASQPRK